MLQLAETYKIVPNKTTLTSKPYSRIFLFKGASVILYDDFIQINDTKIRFSPTDAFKKGNILQITDGKNLYILDFDLLVITNKPACMNNKSINRNENGINKEEFQITEDEIKYKNITIPNQLYPDFDYEGDVSVVYFYFCVVNNKYIFVVNDKTSTVTLFNEKLEEVPQEIIYVLGDDNSKSKFIMGLDSYNNKIAQINQEGEVMYYKVKDLEELRKNKEKTNNEQEADDESESSEDTYSNLMFVKYVGEEENNIFGDILIDNKKKEDNQKEEIETLKDLSIKEDSEAIASDETHNDTFLQEFPKCESENEDVQDGTSEDNSVEGDTNSREENKQLTGNLDMDSLLKIVNETLDEDTIQKNNESVTNEKSVTDKNEDTDEDDFSIANLKLIDKSNQQQPCDDNTQESIFLAKNDTNIKEDDIKPQDHKKFTEDNIKTEDHKNFSKDNIKTEEQPGFKKDKDDLKKGFSFINDSTKPKDDFFKFKEQYNKTKMDNNTTKDGDFFSLLAAKSTAEKAKSAASNINNNDLSNSITPQESKSIFNINNKEKDQNNKEKDQNNKEKEVSKKAMSRKELLSDSVDKIISDFKSIKVNKFNTCEYRIKEYNIDSKMDSLYNKIMSLENVETLQFDLEDKLSFMLNKLSLRNGIDNDYIKNSIKFFDTKINQKTRGRIPFIYSCGILDLNDENKLKKKEEPVKEDSNKICTVELERVYEIEKLCTIRVNSRDNTQNIVNDLPKSSNLQKDNIPQSDNVLQKASNLQQDLNLQNNNNVPFSNTAGFVSNNLKNTLHNNSQPEINQSNNNFQNTNVFNMPVNTANASFSMTSNSSDIFNKMMSSGSSIPVIKREENTNNSEMKAPNAFSRFANSNNLYK